MQPESPKLLEDARGAIAYILAKTHGLSLDAYLADDVLRPAVERHFEIIGEALNRLAKRDPQTVARIDNYAQIIAFRNVLIHGYDAIDHRRVWDAIKNHLLVLHEQIVALLREAEDDGAA
jgi:uncharacterized protein with HEPN domain